MSAIQKLKQQSQGESVSNTLNLSIRHLLAKAVRDSGKFNDVRVKVDNRRGSLNLIVNGSSYNRTLKTVQEVAKKAGLLVDGNVATQSYTETNFRITTLQEAGAVVAKAAPAAKPAPAKTNALAEGLVQDQTSPAVLVVVGNDRLGYVSRALAEKIKAAVAAEQKPKFVQVTMVNLTKSKPEVVDVPNAIGDAILQQLPSFSQGDWTVKSTGGIVSVKNVTSGGHWVYAKV